MTWGLRKTFRVFIVHLLTYSLSMEAILHIHYKNNDVILKNIITVYFFVFH